MTVSRLQPKSRQVQISNGITTEVIVWIKSQAPRRNIKIRFPAINHNEEVPFFYLDGFKGTISDPNAKISICSIEAFDEDNSKIGELFQQDNDKNVQADYVYSDRDVTIKGVDGDEEIDCHFKKGWNIVYTVCKDKNYPEFYTTQKPSGINLKWYCKERF
jgi:hypothetical protein